MPPKEILAKRLLSPSNSWLSFPGSGPGLGTALGGTEFFFLIISFNNIDIFVRKFLHRQYLSPRFFCSSLGHIQYYCFSKETLTGKKNFSNKTFYVLNILEGWNIWEKIFLTLSQKDFLSKTKSPQRASPETGWSICQDKTWSLREKQKQKQYPENVIGNSVAWCSKQNVFEE